MNDEYCLKAKRNFSVGVRAGLGSADSLRGYVKLGYANGKIKASYTDFDNSANNISESDSRGGMQFGAGMEYPLGGEVYTKLEYLYTDYKGFDIDAFTTGDFSRHQVVGGVGVKF